MMENFNMKLYNPLKPHIVTDGTLYCIRKWFIFLGFCYFDLYKRDYWWISRVGIRHCWHDELEFVKKILPISKKHKKDGSVAQWRI